MADPGVIRNIKKAAAATGADPVALLATSLTEDGARFGIIGDQGTSEGAFQFHRGGALPAGKPLTWGDSYAAFLNRAQEFAKNQVHHGKGAAAIQRPADPSGYAVKVDANTAQARRLLGNATPAPSRQVASQPQVTAPTPGVIPGSSLLQSLIDANAANAGIASIQLPVIPTIAPPTIPAQQPAKPSKQPQAPTAQGAFGKVVTMPNPKIIGVPYQGTHTLGNWESDNATDIAMPTGTPIYAPTAGVIGSQIGSLGASAGSRFAGLRVHLKTGGNELYYAHLSRLAVKAGQRVKAGQIIGYSGSANGVQHLHLGVRKGDPRRFA